MQFNAVYPAWIVARREIRDQLRDWRIIFPVVGLTLVFPFIMNWTASQMLNFVQSYGAGLVGERLVPFLLMIVGFFPISVSLVIALETFVGEKERNSIEPLLNTPLKDWQLYLGKLISSTVPPLLSSYLGMTVYLIGLAINHIPWPEPSMLLLIFSMTTVQAFMMVSGAVVVSSQATSVRAANLLSSFIVIPSAFLIQWESLVMFWGNNASLWWVTFGVLVITILLMRVGLAHFQREELLRREIDVLRIKWSAGVFWHAFTGDANNILVWYRQVLPRTIRRLRLPTAIIAAVALLAVLIGWQLMARFPLQLPIDPSQSLGERMKSVLDYLPFSGVGTVIAIFWQNLRILLLAMVLGLFSFGVVGMLPLLATMAIAGYLMAVLAGNGIAVIPLFGALIAPHGIFEIPAAILATAAVMQMGAVLATPTPGQTIGEVWLVALADWTKVMLGVVMPLLILGAFIEAWVTPQIAIYILGS